MTSGAGIPVFHPLFPVLPDDYKKGDADVFSGFLSEKRGKWPF
jgi:hypothetical protein